MRYEASPSVRLTYQKGFAVARSTPSRGRPLQMRQTQQHSNVAHPKLCARHSFIVLGIRSRRRIGGDVPGENIGDEVLAFGQLSIVEYSSTI